MADPVAIADRAQRGTWACCSFCKGHRRVDDLGLCYKCAPRPEYVELVQRRAENGRLRAAGLIAEELTAKLQRLDHRNDTTRRRMRALRKDLADLSELRAAYFALPLTEHEYLTLISIMVDIIADDPDIPTLSIHRKLVTIPERNPQ